MNIDKLRFQNEVRESTSRDSNVLYCGASDYINGYRMKIGIIQILSGGTAIAAYAHESINIQSEMDLIIEYSVERGKRDRTLGGVTKINDVA